MTDESYSFTAAKTRLDEIVTQVRKKDTSLEKSLDLLEEGVRLANVCTELIDHADWVNVPSAPVDQVETEGVAAETVADATNAESIDESVVAEEAVVTADESRLASDGPETDDVVGDVWSEDEAWADDTEGDPSDGDGGDGA